MSQVEEFFNHFKGVVDYYYLQKHPEFRNCLKTLYEYKYGEKIENSDIYKCFNRKMEYTASSPENDLFKNQLECKSYSIPKDIDSYPDLRNFLGNLKKLCIEICNESENPDFIFSHLTVRPEFHDVMVMTVHLIPRASTHSFVFYVDALEEEGKYRISLFEVH